MPADRVLSQPIPLAHFPKLSPQPNSNTLLNCIGCWSARPKCHHCFVQRERALLLENCKKSIAAVAVFHRLGIPFASVSRDRIVTTLSKATLFVPRHSARCAHGIRVEIAPIDQFAGKRHDEGPIRRRAFAGMNLGGALHYFRNEFRRVANDCSVGADQGTNTCATRQRAPLAA